MLFASTDIFAAAGPLIRPKEQKMAKQFWFATVLFLFLAGSCSGPPPAKLPAAPAGPVVVKEGV